MPKHLSIFKAATLLALVGVLVATSTGIAQPTSKVARSLDMAYRLAGGNMMQWAASCFQDAIIAEPTNVEALLLGGAAWYAINEEDQAIELWQQAEELGEGAAASLLGDALLNRGDLAGAQAAYERAVANLPQAARAHLGLALIAEQKGHLQEAIQHVERLVELPSSQAEAEEFVPLIDAYYHLGRLYLEDEQSEKAVKVLRQGTLLNAHHPGMYLLLGQACEHQNLISEAVHAYERALQLAPNSAVAEAALRRLQR